MAVRYVWLDLNTGKFSNSWDKETHDTIGLESDEELIKKSTDDNWKLIKYECVNDEKFELYNLMSITTTPQKK